MSGKRNNRKQSLPKATEQPNDPLFRQKLEHAARHFFQDADHDGGGSISPLEFAKHLKQAGKKFKRHEGHSRGKSWFASPFSIYQQIDDDSSGEIDESEFVEFVMNNKDDSNAMFRQLLMDADTPDIPPPLPPSSAPPSGPLAPLPELMEEEDKQREQEMLAATEAAKKAAAEARRAAAAAEAKRKAAAAEAAKKNNSNGSLANKSTGGDSKAKRRATNAFLDDPTMKQKGKNDGSVNQLEEVELQMLRGIFAAHDENKDGIINKSQLAEALVSLGFSPSEKLMTKFYLENAKNGKNSWKLDLPTFLSAASKWLDTADDCSSDVLYLFEQFDKTNSGDVSGQVVRHLLHEAIAPTRLSRQETDEFMVYSGILGNLNSDISYEALIDKLMF